jgi:hypothetical protein
VEAILIKSKEARKVVTAYENELIDIIKNSSKKE